MPARSKHQQEFMGAELERARKGLPRQTKMTIQQLEDFARTDRKDLPAKVTPKKRKKR